MHGFPAMTRGLRWRVDCVQRPAGKQRHNAVSPGARQRASGVAKASSKRCSIEGVRRAAAKRKLRRTGRPADCNARTPGAEPLAHYVADLFASSKHSRVTDRTIPTVRYARRIERTL
jgi:hypothetical protein